MDAEKLFKPFSITYASGMLIGLDRIDISIVGKRSDGTLWFVKLRYSLVGDPREEFIISNSEYGRRKKSARNNKTVIKQLF